MTRRLIRLRRTCSTELSVYPFSAHAGLEPLLPIYRLRSRRKFLLINQDPRAFVFCCVFGRIVRGIVVLQQTPIEIIRLSGVEFSRRFGAENVHEEHRDAPSHTGRRKSRGNAAALKTPPPGLEPVTRRLIRPRRTCTTELSVNPFSADPGFANFLRLSAPAHEKSRGNAVALKTPPPGLEPVTRRLIRLRRTCSTKSDVNPFSADPDLQHFSRLSAPTHEESRGSVAALKTPPVGLEPTTRRLTAACSTS